MLDLLCINKNVSMKENTAILKKGILCMDRPEKGEKAFVTMKDKMEVFP